MKRRRVERRREAAERAAARAERGDVGQLTKLEREGYGHTKEAKRLRARIAKAKS